MHLDLSDDEAAALTKHLRQALDEAPYPLAPRLDPLKAILGAGGAAGTAAADQVGHDSVYMSRQKPTIVKANNMANNPNVDDAICAILDLIRRRRSDISANGYDVYLSGVCNIYAIESGMVLAGDRNVDRVGIGLLPIFAAAGWELCRRGILRPGVQNIALHHPLNAFSPDRGYSITPAGERWFATANPLLYVPTDPSRLTAMLTSFSPKFGSGFGQRAEEAVKCYNALAHLACCAMCGAAAESILLALAIERREDADAVLRDYRASGGRTRVEKNLLGQVGEPTKSRFHTFMDLLNYWRDDSAHGTLSGIGDPEAFDALSRLLRLAHFATEHWTLLAGKP